MLRKFLLSFTAVCTFCGYTYAQDSLNLQQCISYALEHNTTVLRSTNERNRQKNNFTRDRASALPSINGQATQSYNFGRTIDPFTNQFANQSIRANSFSLEADWTIFGGLAKLNEIRQNQWARNASEYNLQKAKDDISLTIANQYLQIMLLTERQKQLSNQLDVSNSQLKRARTLYEAGSSTESKVLEAQAQAASDESSLIDIQNQLTQAYYTLKQQMGYDAALPVRIINVNFAGQLPDYTSEDVGKAVKDHIPQLPAIQAAQSSIQSAMFGIRSAQGGYSPRLNFSASIHSVYSSSSQNYSYVISGYEPIGILGTDTSKVVYGPRLSPTGKKIPFSDQIRSNYGQTLGFSLVIPIFNGFQTRYAVQNSRVVLSNAQLDLFDAQLKAKTDIYEAYDNMQSSKKKMAASQVRMNAQEVLYRQGNINFNAGAINYYDLTVIKTNYNNAQTDLLQAKYSYIFQTKVFEYYLGKPVQF